MLSLELLCIVTELLFIDAIDVVLEPLVARKWRGVVLKQSPAGREVTRLAFFDMVKAEEVVETKVRARVLHLIWVHELTFERITVISPKE